LGLISIPANPAPEGATVISLTTADGVSLRVARWDGRPKQRGTVVIVTGRAEFIERYFETVAELLARGFAVVTLDWRGQGLSERQLGNARKGHIDDFEIYERDLIALRDQVLAPSCPKPWFALGHSMGAAVLLAQAHAGRSPFARLMLTSPMIDLYQLRFKTGARLVIEGLDIVGLGGAYIPGGNNRSIFIRPFARNFLTSDAARHERTIATLEAAPQLIVGSPTVSWSNAALRLMRQFENPDYARRTLTPILVIAAGADRIVATPAIEAFASRLKAGHFITLPQARHDLLMERDVFRSKFWAAFDAFVPGADDELARTLRAVPPRRRRRKLAWPWPLAARV
jgi:lysophospholipase